MKLLPTHLFASLRINLHEDDTRAKKVSSAALEEKEDEVDIDGDEDGEGGEVVRGVNVGRMLKDRQSENVARDVIRYLEGLRDGVGS